VGSPAAPVYLCAMRHLPLLSLVCSLLGACTTLEGTWYGACDFSDGSESYRSELESQIEDGRGTDLSGKLTLNLFDGRVFTGPLTGLRSGEYVEVEATFETQAGDYLFVASGTQNLDEIKGECSFAVPGGTGALEGDWLFEQ